MKLLLCSRIEDIDVLRSLLAQEGIACEVTNDSGALTGAEFYPKLWVVEDADFAPATAVLDSFRKLVVPKAGSWTCSGCGERLEEQFDCCWKCGKARNETA